MMVRSDYSEAAVEVLNVIQYINLQDMKKIPQSFIEFLQTISAKNYKVNFDRETKIENLNLQEKSKELLGFIYITWLCDKKEFSKWKNEIQKEKAIKNIKISEQYNPDILFKKGNRTSVNQEKIKNEELQKVEMITYDGNNIIKRIYEKIGKWIK